jgi:hypothetical protein
LASASPGAVDAVASGALEAAVAAPAEADVAAWSPPRSWSEERSASCARDGLARRREASASVAAKGRPARQKGVLRDVTAIPGAAKPARTLDVQA